VPGRGARGNAQNLGAPAVDLRVGVGLVGLDLGQHADGAGVVGELHAHVAVEGLDSAARPEAGGVGKAASSASLNCGPRRCLQ
jgi:hypothetical protein